jgi:hypothetical protein
MNIFIAHITETQFPQNSIQFQLDRMDFEKSIARAGLTVDQLIFFDQKPIDLVCVLVDNMLNFQKMISIAEHLPSHSDAIYFANGNVEGSFFCKPSTFSIICNLYKIDFTPYKINGDSKTATFGQKLMCLINRLNLSALPL